MNLSILLSNNRAPDFPRAEGIVNNDANTKNTFQNVPPGLRFSTLTSASQTFLTGHAPRTLCGWAKSSVASGTHWIASYGTPKNSQAMMIGMVGTTLDAGGYANDLTVPNFWDTDWHFIALTYDGTTACLYADGVLKTSATEHWDLVPSACFIGKQVDNGAEYWSGSIDDVRVYDYALSAAQISSLASGKPQ